MNAEAGQQRWRYPETSIRDRGNLAVPEISSALLRTVWAFSTLARPYDALG
jgi:hypothetical protein